MNEAKPLKRPTAEAEQELYDELSLYLASMRTPSEDVEGRTFVVFMIEETHDGVNEIGMVVNPQVPTSGGTKEIMRMPMHARAAVKSAKACGKTIGDILDEEIQIGGLLTRVADAVGEKAATNIVDFFMDIVLRLKAGEITEEEANAERDKFISELPELS